MKLSWLFVILLLIFVAVFSVQNAGVITVRFISWEFQISAALVIQLAALLGGLVGLACGAWSRRTSRPPDKPPSTSVKSATPATPTPVALPRPALPSPPSATQPTSSSSSTLSRGDKKE